MNDYNRRHNLHYKHMMAEITVKRLFNEQLDLDPSPEALYASKALESALRELSIIRKVIECTPASAGRAEVAHNDSQGEFDSPRWYQIYAINLGMSTNDTSFAYPIEWHRAIEEYWPSSLQAETFYDYVLDDEIGKDFRWVSSPFGISFITFTEDTEGFLAAHPGWSFE